MPWLSRMVGRRGAANGALQPALGKPAAGGAAAGWCSTSTATTDPPRAVGRRATAPRGYLRALCAARARLATAWPRLPAGAGLRSHSSGARGSLPRAPALRACEADSCAWRVRSACERLDESSLHILACLGAHRRQLSCRPEPSTASDTLARQGRSWQGRARRTRERSRWAQAPSRPGLAPPCTLVQVAGISVSSRRPSPAEGCPSPLQRLHADLVLLFCSSLAPAIFWSCVSALSPRGGTDAPYSTILEATCGAWAACIVRG